MEDVKQHIPTSVSLEPVKPNSGIQNLDVPKKQMFKN